jgi:hypothetical protein
MTFLEVIYSVGKSVKHIGFLERQVSTTHDNEDIKVFHIAIYVSSEFSLPISDHSILGSNGCPPLPFYPSNLPFSNYNNHIYVYMINLN